MGVEVDGHQRGEWQVSTATRERPILFSGPMVQAIREGRKTMTRRVIDCNCNSLHSPGKLLGEWGLSRPPYRWEGGSKLWQWRGKSDPTPGDWIEEWQTDVDDYETGPVRCPYGKPGDRLWAPEEWAAEGSYTDRYTSEEIVMNPGHFKVWRQSQCFDGRGIGLFNLSFLGRWRPASDMPRWAARLLLEITEIRVERLQEITPVDARAEGVECPDDQREHNYWGGHLIAFRSLWDSINGKRPGCSWSDNPWVWAISFKPVEASN